MAMILWGTIDAASDQTMSTVTRRVGSEFRQAVSELISDVAAGIIANDPSIIAAAEAAVAAALAASGAVTSEPSDHDSVEWVDNHGYVHAAIDQLRGGPRLRGSWAPSARRISGDGIQVINRSGYVLERVSGGGGGGDGTPYTETHLIVGAGQSNMRGTGGPIPLGSNDALTNLFTVPQSGSSQGMIVPASEPLSHPLGVRVGWRGPLWAFARKYALEHPNVRVVIVPVAWSGTGMWGSDQIGSWAPSRESESGLNSLYRGAITRTNAAYAMTGASRIAAILWHQGETDGRAETAASTYRTEFEALIAGFASQMSGASAAPFLIGQIGYEYREVVNAGTIQAIDAVHKATPGRVSRTAFAAAPPAGYMQDDDLHFTGEGYELLADNYWGVYRDALYNL